MKVERTHQPMRKRKTNVRIFNLWNFTHCIERSGRNVKMFTYDKEKVTKKKRKNIRSRSNKYKATNFLFQHRKNNLDWP